MTRQMGKTTSQLVMVAAAGLLIASTGCKNKPGGPTDLENWGEHVSMVLDAGGTPHVAFYHKTHQIGDDREETVGALMYGTGKVGGDTAEFRYHRVDGDVRAELPNAGQYNSLALLPDGRPAISYYEKTNEDLKYAEYDGSRWNVVTVDSGGTAGKGTSLAIAKDGTPRIAYYRNGDLAFAFKTGDAWQTAVADAGVNAADDVGKWPSLALDASDNPVISYYDATNGSLNLITGTGTTFAGPGEVVDNSVAEVGQWSDLVLVDDQPRISYHDVTNQDLKYAARDGGGVWTLDVVDSGEWTGADSDLAIDADGNPHIAYFEGYNNDLKYAFHDGGGWSTTIVAGDGGNGYFNNIALGADGKKHFAFYSFTNTNVNYIIVQ